MAVIGNAPFQGLVSGGEILDASIEGVDLSTSAIAARLGYTPVNPGAATFTANTIINDNSANAALRITQTGAGNALLVEDSTNPDATPFVIDASGRVIVGYTTPITGAQSYIPPLQVSTGNTNDSGVGVNAFSAGSGAGYLHFNRSKSSTVGTNTLVTSTDTIGTIVFAGADGTGFIRAATIQGLVDGTPGTNDMPGRLVFATTADGASSPTERMRISSTGQTTISGNAIISVTDNTNAALRITQLGTGNALLVEDSTNPDATPFVIDASGNTVVGSTAPIATVSFAGGAITPLFQVQGTGLNSSSAGVSNWSGTAASASSFVFSKSNSGTIGTRGAVASATNLGSINFAGDDGTNFVPAASILAVVDGTPGMWDMPGRLVFNTTADGDSVPTERMRIDSSGNVGIGRTPGAARLDLEAASGQTKIILRNVGNTVDASTYIAAETGSSGDWANLSLAARHAVVFLNNNTERMRLDSSGNLLVGTTTSTSRLVVATKAAGTNTITLVGGLANNSTGDSAINFQGYNSSGGFGASGTILVTQDASGNTSAGRMTFSTSAAGGVGEAERMRIDSSGNLLVGTTSSLSVADKLTVVGGNFAVRRTSGITTFMGDNTVDGYAGTATNHAFALLTNSTERMRIDSSGRLGIGTNTPVVQLHVGSYATYGSGNGEIELASSSSGWGSVLFGDGGTGSDYYRGYLQYQHNGDYMLIGTASAERMRITNTGNVLINTTGNTFGSRLAVVGSYPQVAGSFETNNSTYAAISCYASQGNYPADQIAFYSNVSSTVTFSGKITCTTSTVSYGSGSDYRLKNNITPMIGALAKVALLNPVVFKWNVDGSDGEGFIAHELQTVIPIAVSGEKDETDENGKPRYQTVDTSFLIATLTAAIQEQQTLIQQLTARLDAANL